MKKPIDFVNSLLSKLVVVVFRQKKLSYVFFRCLKIW